MACLRGHHLNSMSKVLSPRWISVMIPEVSGSSYCWGRGNHLARAAFAITSDSSFWAVCAPIFDLRLAGPFQLGGDRRREFEAPAGFGLTTAMRTTPAGTPFREYVPSGSILPTMGI